MTFAQLCENVLPEIPITILQALAEVESSGNGWKNDRIKVRFEQPHFLLNCPEAKDTFFVNGDTHTFLTDGGLIYTHDSQDTEYQALKLATSICPMQSYKYISIGTWQIFGIHYSEIGFPLPSLLWSYMSESQERECQILKRYIQIKPELKKAMVNEDLDKIAELYNPHNPYWKQSFMFEYNKLKQSK